MSRLWNRREVEQFARNTLGCGCPDKVFEKINIDRIENSGQGGTISRVDIGNTLLVYIVRPESNKELHNSVARIVSQGREDRDSNGFNRFRLVVAGEAKELDGETAIKAFAGEIGTDEKMHLHFVSTDAVDGL
ncbi:MAG: hypothetical protein V2I36_10295 [Desulfopila sp.]|nr:hypothetical protein [Desulfopila sp.]